MSDEMTPLTESAPANLAEMLERLRTKAEQLPDVPVAPDGKCRACGGTRWVMDDENRASRCVECMTGDPYPPTMPFEFRDATMATYEALPGNAAAIRFANAFLVADLGDLYLHGKVGTGKSRLAASILNEVYRRTRAGLFARVPRLLHDLLPNTHAPEARGQIEQGLRTAPILVLDDVGAERDEATDFSRRTLFEIYEDRCDAKLRTIWTSNKSIQELNEYLDDERLASRIHNRADVIELTTQDQRFARKRRA